MGGVHRSARGRFVRRWAVSALILWLLGVTFALCAPVGAGPDEPAQVIKAAATVRGEWIGRPLPRRPEGPTTIVRVPRTFAAVQRLVPCFDEHPDQPAGCAPSIPVSARPTRATTYVGRYLPLYYLAVGIPTLVSSRPDTVYAMRAVSALLSAILLGLALAVASCWSRSRLMVVAVALAATPTVVYTGDAVNPNGLAISAAVAAWTCGLVLVRDRAADPPRGLLAAFGVTAAAICLTEALALAWVVLLGLTLPALEPAGVARLLRRRAGLLTVAAVAGVGAGAAVYAVAARSYRVAAFGARVPPGAPWTRVASLVWQRERTVFAQSVGSFGQPDTFAPPWLWIPWLAVVLAGVLLALAGLRRAQDRRSVVCLLGLLAAAVVVPTALMWSHARADGVVWQARDGMALYVGIPLLLGATLDPTGPGVARWSGPVRTAAPVLVAAGMIASVLLVLRRFTVGLDGPLSPLAHVPDRWDPAVPTLLLLVAAVVVPVAYGLWLRILIRDPLGVRTGSDWIGPCPQPRQTVRSPRSSPTPPPRPSPDGASPAWP